MAGFIIGPPDRSSMVERIGIALVVVVAVIAILYAIPRYLVSSASNGDHDESSSDVMGLLDELGDAWLSKPRAWDMGLGVVALVFLAAGMMVYLVPTLVGGLAEQVEFVAFSLAGLGLAGIFSTTYLNVRRSGLYSAEATLIGLGLVGSVLILLMVAILVQ